MAHHYGWTLADMEDAIPFEMAMYTALTKDHIEKVKKARESA